MRDPPTSLASLPPELLDRIAYFVPRPALTDCILVSKAWLACFRPILWQEVDLLDWACDDFVAQFQLYYGFVRSLSFSIPSSCNAIQSLLGDPASKIPALPGAKTLAHCTRLQSLQIAFDEDCYHEGGLDHDLMASIIDRIVGANLSTLQQFKFSHLPYSIEDSILDQISKMTLLSSLSLEGWGALSAGKLLAILKSRRSTLKSLSLEMNEMSMGVEPFEELQHWRAEVVEAGVKGGGKTSEDELNQHLAANLTRITTLVLDRATIDPITLTRLAGVMPDLRKLSFKSSFGLGRNMDDIYGFQHAGNGGHINFEQPALNNYYNFLHMANQTPVPTASNNPASSEADDLVEGASAGAEEMPVAAQLSDEEHQEQEQEQEQDDSMPTSAHPIWTVHDDPFDAVDEDLGDDFEDYLGSGDEDFDYEHYQGLYHAGVATASNGDFDYAHHQSLYAAGIANANTHQTHMLQPLHKLCPKIEVFDFTGCRTEGVDHHFLLKVCQLWGSAYSAMSGRQTLGGLKVLDARDVLQVERPFFDAVWTNCSTTLTGLDLSWNDNIRAHMSAATRFASLRPPTTYYDDILSILTSCPHLEYLHVEPYPVNGRKIQLSTANWVCTKLKSLKLCIGVELSVAGDEDEVRIAVCKQLGRLVHLKTLHLESEKPIPLAGRGRRDQDLRGFTLSLASGLDHLAGLEDLESLNISRLVSHGLREEAEMAWIESHWPALNHFVGFLDRDVLSETAKEIKTQLGRPAQFMPAAKPSQGFARQNAMKRQRAGIALPAEMDLELNPLTRRLRERGINVDPRVIDDVLLEEQLHTVAQEDKNGIHVIHRPNGGDDVLDEHGNKPPPQMFSWVVCYLPSVTAGWDDVRLGGRSNEEYMSYVMRPRGGRSPSPLGTWY